MADVELVIKIPEEIRIGLINNSRVYLGQRRSCDSCIKEAIINGIEIPKRHGRLIDADLLDMSLEYVHVNLEDKLSEAFDDGLRWASEVLHHIPTIVETDKAESEG